MAAQDRTEQTFRPPVLKTTDRRCVAAGTPQPIYRVGCTGLARAVSIRLVRESSLINEEVFPGVEVLAVTVVSASTVSLLATTVATFPLIALPSIHDGAVDDALTVLPRSASSGV